MLDLAVQHPLEELDQAVGEIGAEQLRTEVPRRLFHSAGSGRSSSQQGSVSMAVSPRVIAAKQRAAAGSQRAGSQQDRNRSRVLAGSM